MTLRPQHFQRNDLLADPRFWCLYFEDKVDACVGDSFTSGEDYFFGLADNARSELIAELESLPCHEECYPAVNILFDLSNQWRIGVQLAMYPEDFCIPLVLQRPGEDDYLQFGIYGGNVMLPALRWDEAVLVHDKLANQTTQQAARLLLLLFAGASYSTEQAESIRQQLSLAWQASGITIDHGDELLARMVNGWDIDWDNDPELGWISSGRHSQRHPANPEAALVLPLMKEFFASL